MSHPRPSIYLNAHEVLIHLLQGSLKLRALLLVIQQKKLWIMGKKSIIWFVNPAQQFFFFFFFGLQQPLGLCISTPQFAMLNRIQLNARIYYIASQITKALAWFWFWLVCTMSIQHMLRGRCDGCVYTIPCSKASYSGYHLWEASMSTYSEVLGHGADDWRF